jgi:hypothetical protein
LFDPKDHQRGLRLRSAQPNQKKAYAWKLPPLRSSDQPRKKQTGEDSLQSFPFQLMPKKNRIRRRLRSKSPCGQPAIGSAISDGERGAQLRSLEDVDAATRNLSLSHAGIRARYPCLRKSCPLSRRQPPLLSSLEQAFSDAQGARACSKRTGERVTGPPTSLVQRVHSSYA